jgi:hypothetical protein
VVELLLPRLRDVVDLLLGLPEVSLSRVALLPVVPRPAPV